jgi:predicted dehydrogenase
MKLKVLIVGLGSAGKRHATILKNKFKISNIYFLTKKKNQSNSIKSNLEIKKINPDYIIIANPTSEHFKVLKFLEKNFSGKIILVEKPLYEKFRNLNIRKNKVFVAYQLRFHPVILKLKELSKSQKLFNINVIANSYLPDWRKTNYRYSYSSKKKQGGGVLLDLSHELDYINWIFPNIKFNFFLNKKISTLDINSDDIAIINGSLNKKLFCQINLNYFSMIPKRLIFLDGKNISFYGDLINNFYRLNINKKIKRKKIKISKFYLTYQLHKSILEKKYKNLCSYNDGLNLLKIMNKLNNNKYKKI